MIISNYKLLIKHKGGKIQPNLFPFIYTIKPYLLSRYLNYPTSTNTTDKFLEAPNRIKAIEQTTCLMYKKVGDNYLVVNIPQVPTDLIRNFLEDTDFKKFTFPNTYNPNINSDFDINSFNNGENSFLYRIAGIIAKDINIPDTISENDLPAKSNEIEKEIRKFGFYFLYDNVNYKDVYVYFQPCFLNGNNIVYGNFLLRNVNRELIDSVTPNLGYSGDLTYTVGSNTYSEASYIFDFLLKNPIGMLVNNSYVRIDVSYIYKPEKGIHKDAAINDFMRIERQDSVFKTLNYAEQIYKYYDYSTPKKILGHGFVVKHYNIKNDVYYENESVLEHNIFVTAGSLFQYVPYLTGVLQFLIAYHLGFRPLLSIKNNKPVWNNVERTYGGIKIGSETYNEFSPPIGNPNNLRSIFYANSAYYADTILQAAITSFTYKQFLERYYYKKIYFAAKNNKIYVFTNEKKTNREIESISDFILFFEENSNLYELVYFDGSFSFNDLYKVMLHGNLTTSASNNYVRLIFEYLTDLTEEPGFISSYFDILKEITGEDLSPNGNLAVEDTFIKRFPCMIVYNSNTLKYPITMKNMDIYYDDKATTTMKYKPRDYKYLEIQDPVKWGVFPLDNFINVVQESTTFSSTQRVYPPVIDETKTIGSLFNFYNFNFIISRDILKYPSIFEEDTFPTKECKEYRFGNDPDNPNVKMVYWREYMLNKYMRYIFNFIAWLAIFIYYKNSIKHPLGGDIVSLNIGKTREYIDENGAKRLEIEAKATILTFIMGKVKEVNIQIELDI